MMLNWQNICEDDQSGLWNSQTTGRYTHIKCKNTYIIEDDPLFSRCI